MDRRTIISIGGPIIGIFVGYFIKYLLDKKQKKEEILQEKKRQQYKEFSSLMLEIIHNTKKGELQTNDIVDELYIIYKDFVLFANSKVIRTFGDFMQYLYVNNDNVDTKKLFEIRCKMFYEMRKDIGLSNRKLGNNGEKLLRPLFKDYNTFWE